MKPHPVIWQPGQPVITGSMTAASVRSFAVMLAAGKVYVDSQERHLPLRHSHHRYSILGPNGEQKLTIPLVGSTNAMPVTMQKVRISEHANWRHLHWGALYSAYGRTPYFDYIADDLHQLLLGDDALQDDSLLNFNERLQQLIIEFLDLPIKIAPLPHNSTQATDSKEDTEHYCDLRRVLGTKKPDGLPITDVPYYQMWADRHGFVPNLSILDLLMNKGREAIFTLMKMTSQS